MSLHQVWAKEKTRCILKRNYSENVDCALCLQSMSGKLVRILPCGHIFHNNCFQKQLLSNIDAKYSCSLCRMNIYNSLPAFEKPANLFKLSENDISDSDSSDNDSSDISDISNSSVDSDVE